MARETAFITPPVTSFIKEPAKHGIRPEVIGSTSVAAYESWTTWSCGIGSTWTTLRPYAACRWAFVRALVLWYPVNDYVFSTTALLELPMFTSCTNGSIMLGPWDTIPCTGTAFAQTSCITGYVHYDHGLILSNFECWPSWTGGNWEAWRETPKGSPSISTLATSIVLPIVAVSVAAVIIWLRIRRKRLEERQASLIGQPSSEDTMSDKPLKPILVAENVEVSDVKDTKELEEQRRASELSTVIVPHGCINCINCRLQTLQESTDDVSSYHTTASRIKPAELDSTERPHPGEVVPRSGPALYRMLQRFQM